MSAEQVQYLKHGDVITSIFEPAVKAVIMANIARQNTIIVRINKTFVVKKTAEITNCWSL